VGMGEDGETACRRIRIGDRKILDMKKKKISIQNSKIAEFCHYHHIRKLSLFGSVLRDDFRPNSDIDVLVEFEPDHIPSFFRLFDMEDELSAMFGRKVDLRTPEDLSKYFRDEVIATAEVHYAQE
jgi:predicted nucleotidyltransferase